MLLEWKWTEPRLDQSSQTKLSRTHPYQSWTQKLWYNWIKISEYSVIKYLAALILCLWIPDIKEISFYFVKFSCVRHQWCLLTVTGSEVNWSITSDGADLVFERLHYFYSIEFQLVCSDRFSWMLTNITNDRANL